MADERLQKIIAQAGIASRRKAETLIKEGRVRLNGRVVTELGTRADPRRDRVEVNGKRITVPKAWKYIILNKPSGVVTTASDEFERKTVLDLIKVSAGYIRRSTGYGCGGCTLIDQRRKPGCTTDPSCRRDPQSLSGQSKR